MESVQYRACSSVRISPLLFSSLFKFFISAREHCIVFENMKVPITPSKDVEVTGYTISFGDDGTLQFDPPQDSRKLAIALSIQFPMQRTLVDKLRAAQLSFLRSQGQNSADPETDPQQETTVALPTPKSAQLSNHGVIEKLRGIGNRQESMTLPQTKESEGEANKSYSDPSHSQKPKMKKRVRESPENASQPESNPKPMVHIWDSRTGETRQKRTRRTLEDAESVQVYENRGMVCDDHKASKTKVSLKSRLKMGLTVLSAIPKFAPGTSFSKMPPLPSQLLNSHGTMGVMAVKTTLIHNYPGPPLRIS
jgi:hypothetical protein